MSDVVWKTGNHSSLHPFSSRHSDEQHHYRPQYPPHNIYNLHLYCVIPNTLGTKLTRRRQERTTLASRVCFAATVIMEEFHQLPPQPQAKHHVGTTAIIAISCFIVPYMVPVLVMTNSSTASILNDVSLLLIQILNLTLYIVE